jgi:hypothetical protein
MKTNRTLKEDEAKSPVNAPIPGSRIGGAGWKIAVVAFAALGLVGCGTTSNLKPAQADRKLDLSSYNKVVVNDFRDKATEREKPAKQDAKRPEMQRVCRDFADRLADEIEKKGCFHTVSRSGPEDESTLLIGGNVLRYEAGSAAARFWVGMGAGSSYFDALVEFRQGSTGALLGTITVDKNSWALGGGLAAGQTPEGFMHEAAVKVANEVQKARSSRMVGK